jgi:hypothetical protein
MSIEKLVSAFNIPWWIYTFMGAFSLVFMNSFKKTLEVTPLNLLLLFPLLVMVDMGFWLGFRNCNSFIVAWFIGSAFTATLGYTAGILFFDKTFNMYHSAGVLLVVVGAFLLTR